MKILKIVAFYILLMIGGLKMFKGITNLIARINWSDDKLIETEQVPPVKRYYSFRPIEPPDYSEIFISIFIGLLVLGVAYYIRRNTYEETP